MMQSWRDVLSAIIAVGILSIGVYFAWPGMPRERDECLARGGSRDLLGDCGGTR